jgi:hypothetical protein
LILVERSADRCHPFHITLASVTGRFDAGIVNRDRQDEQDKRVVALSYPAHPVIHPLFGHPFACIAGAISRIFSGDPSL